MSDLRGHGDPYTSSAKQFISSSYLAAKKGIRLAGKRKKKGKRTVVILLVIGLVLLVVFSGLESDNCGGGSLSGSTENQIYQFMAGKGFDDLHIACMMGVMWGESGLDPTSVETVYDEPGRIGPTKQKYEEQEFIAASCRPDYKAKHPRIHRLGIGLGGWTDTTDGSSGVTQLRNYATEHGKNWWDLSLQLSFWWCTMNREQASTSGITYHMYRQGYSLDDFLNATTIEEGCRIYMKGYEGILTSSLNKRTTKAKEFYDQMRTGTLSSSDTSANGWSHPCPDYVRISSPFGPRGGTLHKGIDLAAPQGTSIYAAASGTVTISKFSDSAGYYCAIDHGNGYLTKYMHQWRMPDVSVGDEVKEGEKIGEVGTTGQSTGPHLHFQVEKEGEAIDPAPILEGAGEQVVNLSFDCGEGGSTTAGEAAAISLNARMKWLFPNGEPGTEEEMQKYLVHVEVPIINDKGQSTTMTITCHKKLANEIRAAFADMKAAGFKVKPYQTACYAWRMMASGTGARSHHSYGVCIDINSGDNPASYTSGNYAPGENPYSITKEIVQIWKDHGFYWGGDWSGHFKDYMHMTYTDH